MPFTWIAFGKYIPGQIIAADLRRLVTPNGGDKQGNPTPNTSKYLIQV